MVGEAVAAPTPEVAPAERQVQLARAPAAVGTPEPRAASPVVARRVCGRDGVIDLPRVVAVIDALEMKDTETDKHLQRGDLFAIMGP